MCLKFNFAANTKRAGTLQILWNWKVVQILPKLFKTHGTYVSYVCATQEIRMWTQIILYFIFKSKFILNNQPWNVLFYSPIKLRKLKLHCFILTQNLLRNMDLKDEARNTEFLRIRECLANQAHIGAHVVLIKFIDKRYTFSLHATCNKVLPSQITWKYDRLFWQGYKQAGARCLHLRWDSFS
jgi:hypothetical protein